MTTWDERFASGSYPSDPEPSPVLRRYVETFPEGRALDVATGTGRNALFLAEHGYEVDGLDQSREGLRIARETAEDRGIEEQTQWIQGDVASYEFPESAYDVVTISFYRPMDRLPDIKAALRPGGVLFVQHHMRSPEAAAYEVGPSTDRYRFAANELLHACLDLTVLHYSETTESRGDGRQAQHAQVVARNAHGSRQAAPAVDP
ncbi:class I SAM-dependent methyltransferase [Salinirubrum litoreum]|uniref:Class I SAM-dependent methyltransferase n=1 Tax=Salinirubrum litoreum TaxID=1126234 RepID=A0ABD5RFW7_9EURY|nr:class I SAM-dependent methyltransferase [Salinirubrum litoreum]